MNWKKNMVLKMEINRCPICYKQLRLRIHNLAPDEYYCDCGYESIKPKKKIPDEIVIHYDFQMW